MDCLPLYSKIPLSQFPSSTPLFSQFKNKKKSLSVVCSSNSYSYSGSGNCEFSGLTVPLVPTTEAGRSLSGILLNDREGFYGFVEKELVELACLESDALLRSVFSLCSDEAVLHS